MMQFFSRLSTSFLALCCTYISYGQITDLKKKTSVFVSLSNYTPDFGFRKNFSVNLNDELIMRDVNPSNAPGHTWQVGLRTRIGKKSCFVSGVRYSQNKQMILYNNLRNDQDRQQFSFGGFLTVPWLYDHRRLGASIGFNHNVWKGIFIEAGLSPTINVSKKHNGGGLNNIRIDSLYRQVMFENMRQYSKFSLFAHINVGYNWKGIFAAFYYEEHLNSFKRSFAFRGNSYTIKQPHWINKGFTIGYAYTFKKRQQKEKSNL